jgi:hypothetical protein
MSARVAELTKKDLKKKLKISDAKARKLVSPTENEQKLEASTKRLETGFVSRVTSLEEREAAFASRVASLEKRTQELEEELRSIIASTKTEVGTAVQAETARLELVASNGKAKIEELDAKVSELNRKLKEGGDRQTRLKLDPPILSQAITDDPDLMQRYWDELQLVLNLTKITEDSDKVGVFLSTLHKIAGTKAGSITESIKAAVATSVGEVQGGGSPFGVISFADLQEVVTKAFSTKDHAATKASNFLAFKVKSGESFAEALRRFKQATHGSFDDTSATSSSALAMIYAHLVQVFSTAFPETARQFEMRHAIAKQLGSYVPWTVEEMFQQLQETNNTNAELTQLAASKSSYHASERSDRRLQEDRRPADRDRQRDDQFKRRKQGNACYNCGKSGHLAFRCLINPRDNKYKERHERRTGQMPPQPRAKFSSFSEINAVEFQRFKSEHNCSYHCTDGHSVAECDSIKSHRQHGYLWCNACCSTRHDTAACDKRRD